MNTTIEALQNLYVALGGQLTDTYESISGGDQVGNYTVIPDIIEAIKQQAGQATLMSVAAKQALLECFENVVWVNSNGQTYVNNLESALSGEE